MKKTLGILVVMSLVFGAFALPAEAKKKKKKKKPVRIERVVEFNYTCPCTGHLQLGTLTNDGTNVGGGGIPVGAEYYLTATVEDLSGTPVAVGFSQIGDSGLNESRGSMCGETEAPIEIMPGTQINVFIGAPEELCSGVALGGTLTVTLSNLP
jgi:hypothetical protein